jgi:cob(I)alamin adenosyltransferase
MRLTKIYTRTGDDGTTRLGDGTKIGKDNALMEAIGTVDELNSLIGMVIAAGVPSPIGDYLDQIQHRLFDLGGELSVPGHRIIEDDHARQLEQQLDSLNTALPALEDFVLPGGTQAAATCQLARSVCRRAERCLVRLSSQKEVNFSILKYLNRLSDLLFVMARALNQAAGVPETVWQHSK